MSDYPRKDSRFGGPRRNDRGGGADRGERKMYDAVCDDCGNSCKVPFLPSGEKPIYCSDCFSKHGGGDSDRFGGGRQDRPRFDRPQRESTFAPTPDNTLLIKELFGALDKKLDTMIKLLTLIAEKKVVRVAKKTEEEVQ